jgi:hypothetical protein
MQTSEPGVVIPPNVTNEPVPTAWPIDTTTAPVVGLTVTPVLPVTLETAPLPPTAAKFTVAHPLPFQYQYVEPLL